VKYAWIENYRDAYTVSRLCRVLSVSRTGYCQWRVRRGLNRQGLRPVCKRA
jgi:putative transposase